MKQKIGVQKAFVAAFVVLGVWLVSANLAAAQCGNYFKKNYSVISKVSRNFVNPLPSGDWNDDGKSDFWKFQASGTGPGLNVVIYPTKPTGYWDWDNPIVYATTISDGNLGYLVIDMDGDGRKDILHYVNGGFQVHRNAGNGTLTPLPPVTVSGPAFTVGFTDINGDNLVDWLYVRRSESPSVEELRYRLQNADGSFSNIVTILASSPENGFYNTYRTVGDFNGDGKIDILYTFPNNTSHYVLIKNLGGGNFEAGTPTSAPGLFAYNAMRDFNNDGKVDFLGSSSEGLIIFYGQANGIFNRTVTPRTIFGSLYPAELNGDDNPDIIEVRSFGYVTYINNGAGGFSVTEYSKSLGEGQFAFEDFSGDGKADFYSTHPGIDSFTYNIFGEAMLTVRENVCQSFGETKMTDFDGNGRPDVAMWNPNSGNWSSKNAGWQFLTDPNTKVFNWGLGVHADVPAPGDFDGDGKTDYSVYRDSTGIWYIFKSSDSTWLVFPFGLPGDIAMPADYDGGGKTDIAVWRPSTGIWYVWFSETQSFGALHFGAPGDKPVPADYDGDGKTDHAVYRPSEGKWYYMKSSDLSHVVLHWGNATDIPLPADYDGDGRADLAIYRDGFWWIWRSSNNSYSVVQWGQPGDVPMPVYRNSVSADLILHRPSNNSWYSWDFRSVAGFALGGSGDVPVRFGLPNN